MRTEWGPAYTVRYSDGVRSEGRIYTSVTLSGV